MIFESKESEKAETNPTEVPWALAQAPMAGVFTGKRLGKPGEEVG